MAIIHVQARPNGNLVIFHSDVQKASKMEHLEFSNVNGNANKLLSAEIQDCIRRYKEADEPFKIVFEGVVD
jgi:hypothetical protein